MMRETSIAAYRAIEHTLSDKRRRVMSIIANYGPISNKQIALMLGWPINCVTGRTNELVKAGLVIDYCKSREASGKQSILWMVKI